MLGDTADMAKLVVSDSNLLDAIKEVPNTVC